MNVNKFSPQAILSLKEALAVIYWKKENLQDFIKISIEHNAIVGTLNWDGTKRQIVRELIDRMLSRQDIYKTDLLNLLLAVTDFDDFEKLKFWDEDGSKTKKAKDAVLNLRKHTIGYIEKTKEQNEAEQRRREAEQKIIKSKSLEEELSQLKDRFFELARETNQQKRGFSLEKFLYDLLLLYELEPKGSFKNYGEQIDGSFTFQGTDYLLEAKWKRQVDRGDLATFCFKVEKKFKTAVGLMVTIDGVTKEAISPDFKSIIIMDGADITAILEGRVSFTDLLFRKRRKASETGNIYVNFYQL
ncbi:MAG: hypothetical protein ACRCTQ_07125 [Brevinemataceae bacterium]